MIHPTKAEVAAALAAAPRGVWLIAGTDAREPYPCRCHERRYGRCSAAWCPCAGRSDPRSGECCGAWITPAEVVMAKAAWEQRKRAESF